MFFDLFLLSQNPKMASCKGYRVSEKPKKAKKNVEFTDFSKIKTHLKGILEGEKIVETVFFCPPAFSAKQKSKVCPHYFLEALKIKAFQRGVNRNR